MNIDKLNLEQFKKDFPGLSDRLSDKEPNHNIGLKEMVVLLKDPIEKITLKMNDDNNKLEITNTVVNYSSKVLNNIFNTYKELLKEKELKINDLKESIIFSKMINEDICISEESYKLPVEDVEKLKEEISKTKEEVRRIEKTINHIKTRKEIIENKNYL